MEDCKRKTRRNGTEGSVIGVREEEEKEKGKQEIENYVVTDHMFLIINSHF